MKKLEEFTKLVDTIHPNQELNEEDMMSLMGLMMNKDPQLSEVALSDMPELEGAAGIITLLKRLEFLSTVKLTLGVALFIGLFISNFGQAVMYAYYIHRKSKPNTIVDFTMFSMELFPFGTFTEEQLHQFWNAQKLMGEKEYDEAKELKQYGVRDNLLDYQLTWEKELVEV